MYDINEGEKARLRDMARVGHSVTDRDAELLRRVVDVLPEPIEEPQEYPKMVYPEGARHDQSSEPHLVGKPKGFLVQDEDEEREVMAQKPEEASQGMDQSGVDPNAVHGPEPAEISADMAVQRQLGAAAGQRPDPLNERRSGEGSYELEHSPDLTIDHSQDNQLGGKYEGDPAPKGASDEPPKSPPPPPVKVPESNDLPAGVEKSSVPGPTPVPVDGPVSQKSE